MNAFFVIYFGTDLYANNYQNYNNKNKKKDVCKLYRLECDRMLNSVYIFYLYVDNFILVRYIGRIYYVIVFIYKTRKVNDFFKSFNFNLSFFIKL